MSRGTSIRNLGLVLTVTGLALGCVRVAAAEDTRASREFVVSGSGGAFEVPVSPAFVTVLYLPEKVQKALASDQKNFEISVMGDTVAVRPRGAPEGHRANLNVDTSELHLSIILVVTKEDRALSQAFFVRAEAKAELERRVNEEVERRLMPLRRELEAAQKSLERRIQAAADREIASRLLRRYQPGSLDGIARTDDHVVIQVERAVVMGDEAYLFFSVHNRGDRRYTLGGVGLVQGTRKLRARVAFLPSAERPLSGQVDAGARGRGVAVVPYRSIAPGRPFELHFHEANPRRTLPVKGLVLD